MKRNLSFDEIDQIKSLDQMKLNRQKAPTVCGFGVNDVDFVVKVGGKLCRQYRLWASVLHRCYDGKYHEHQPTYIGCSVSDEWKYFSNFLIWVNNQFGYKMKDVKGNSFEIDKDIANKCNKIYSSEYCNFIPKALNLLLVKNDSVRGYCPIGVSFSNHAQKFKAYLKIDCKIKHLGYFNTEIEAFQVYKKAKEDECKRLAKLYKDVISPIVYRALMNYNVDIDD